MMLLHKLQRLAPIRCSAFYFEIELRGQKRGQRLAQDGVVIGNDDAYLSRFVLSGHSRTRHPELQSRMSDAGLWFAGRNASYFGINRPSVPTGQAKNLCYISILPGVLPDFRAGEHRLRVADVGVCCDS